MSEFDAEYPLLDAEIAFLKNTAALSDEFATLLVSGPTRTHDWNEFVVHIHAIQHAVMAQAAARAYPDRFRLLGGSIADPDRLGWTGEL